MINICSEHNAYMHESKVIRKMVKKKMKQLCDVSGLFQSEGCQRGTQSCCSWRLTRKAEAITVELEIQKFYKNKNKCLWLGWASVVLKEIKHLVQVNTEWKPGDGVHREILMVNVISGKWHLQPSRWMSVRLRSHLSERSDWDVR